mmetsp:Transcript_11594/g.13321  ORF Transcript_11594/g.13321 Transcript_11594/m.13321 type:complete len:259 (-) Transcript_11594:129-905(-)
MLEAQLNQALLFKKIIDSMKDLVTDASFDFDDEGLAMQAMDSSHVALCNLKIGKDGFSLYRCDRPTSLGLSLANLAKVLKCSGTEDSLSLKATDEPDSISLLFENQSQDRIMDFEMKLMDIDEENLGIPEQEYKCNIVMDSNEFTRIIRDLSALGDTCVIGCTKESAKFSVSGDIGSANITIKNAKSVENDTGATITVQEPVELTFALRYLKFFTQAAPLSTKVSISMSADVPLLCEFQLNAGSISFYLAPKIEEEGN